MQTPWSDMHSISLFGLLQALVFEGSLHGFCLAWLPQLFDHTHYCIWQHACNTLDCMAFACGFVAKLVYHDWLSSWLTWMSHQQQCHHATVQVSR